MKNRKMLPAMLIIAMLTLMIGCRVSCPDGTEPGTTAESDVFTSPPELKLIFDGGSAPVNLGTHTWNYDKGDGTWSGICSDHAHPLECEALTEPVILPNTQAKLAFEDAPDSIAIQCWPDSAWGVSTADSEGVTAAGFDLQMKPGGYIYEVRAKWNNDGAAYHGTASYFFYAIVEEGHVHQLAQQPQTVADPVSGYCGNTQTTLHIGKERCTFMGGNSVTLTDILINLAYQNEITCRCMAEYRVDTEFGTGYEINLTQGFARCEKGQVDLTKEQIETITEIVEWAKTQKPDE